MKKLLTLQTWIGLLVFVFLFAGCAQANDPNHYPRIGNIEEAQLEKTTSGEMFPFNFPVDQAMLAKGQQISVQASGKIKTGELHVVLRDPQGQTVWDPGGFSGDFTANNFIWWGIGALKQRYPNPELIPASS